VELVVGSALEKRANKGVADMLSGVQKETEVTFSVFFCL
jgi:hypothetical protein